jgi:fructosamine-3-kinase
VTAQDFSHLNHDLSPMAAHGLSDAWQRTLARLGSYTALIVQTLNLRPTAAAIHQQTDRHLLVRLTIPQEHVILRISPEADLGAYVYLLRACAGHSIPAARLIHRDLSRGVVPFAYVVESYVPGRPADQIDAGSALWAAARQAGRLLRRIHRISTPSAGRPNEIGRWPQQEWPAALQRIAVRQRLEPTDSILFNAAERAMLARISSRPELHQVPITLLHGDFGPQAVRCTSGEHVHVEAIAGSGDEIAGDPMFDLALATRPSYRRDWYDGVLDGYLAGTKLSEAEQRRLELYQPLVNSWSACQRYQFGLPHEADLAAARAQLAALDGGAGADDTPPAAQTETPA